MSEAQKIVAAIENLTGAVNQLNQTIFSNMGGVITAINSKK